MKKKAWVSRIDFRPDPADPNKNAISVGLLLEFTTEDYWAIAMVMLAALDDSALAGLDDLSRKLLENREAVIGHEIRRVLPQANKPGHALRLLADANPWSIHVGVPKELDISSVKAARGASAEKLAEKYALSFFLRGRISETRKLRARAASASQDVGHAKPASIPLECPAPWILAPSCVNSPTCLVRTAAGRPALRCQTSRLPSPIQNKAGVRKRFARSLRCRGEQRSRGTSPDARDSGGGARRGRPGVDHLAADLDGT